MAGLSAASSICWTNEEEQRLLALTAAIWHNHKAGQPVLRSLVAYDH